MYWWHDVDASIYFILKKFLNRGREKTLKDYYLIAVNWYIMPGKVKVRILEGRNLPPMDKSTDLADAFVEVSSVALSGYFTKKQKQKNRGVIHFKITSYH